MISYWEYISGLKDLHLSIVIRAELCQASASLVLFALLHADEGKLLKFSEINTLKSVVVLHLDQVRNHHLSDLTLDI